MKTSEFDLGRKKYINLLKRKKKHFEKKQRFYDLLKEPLIREYLGLAVYLSEHNDNELEKKQKLYDLIKEPIIREYLELAVYLNEHNDNEFDENLLSVKAFDKLAKKTNQPYGIYMYMGKDKEKNMILLTDIETLKRISISESSYETLKQSNRVIYIENKNNERDFYEKKLLEMRKEYLSNLKDLDQESAKERILKI